MKSYMLLSRSKQVVEELLRVPICLEDLGGYVRLYQTRPRICWNTDHTVCRMEGGREVAPPHQLEVPLSQQTSGLSDGSSISPKHTCGKDLSAALRAI